MRISFFCCRRKKQIKPMDPMPLALELKQAQKTEAVSVATKVRDDFLEHLHPHYIKYLRVHAGDLPLSVSNQLYVEDHIFHYLRIKDLSKAEQNYYSIFGLSAPNFREKLNQASLMAAGKGKHRDLRDLLMFGVMKTPLTTMQMLSIESYILPAYQAGNYLEASDQYHRLFGFDVLPFSNLLERLHSPRSEPIFRR